MSSMQKRGLKERTNRLIRFDSGLRASISGSGMLCGVDEAGRGPIAGPVVAAAVIFGDDAYIEGIFDSKQLTHNKREELYGQIKDAALAYAVGIVGNIDIDSWNILKATKEAMNIAVGRLKIQPDLIIVDGNFYKSDKSEVKNFIKGDEKSFSIAAASILAKVTRDRLMVEFEKDYPFFSFSAHKGYGTKKHIDEILEHGYTAIHRKSFIVKSLQGELF